MIKFKFESTGHPDYTRITGAQMDRIYTVFDFVDEIMKMYPKDYGEINIDDKASYEYKNGTIDWSAIHQELFNSVVVKVDGISSYNHTDYKLILSDDSTVKEKKGLNIDDVMKELSSDMKSLTEKYSRRIGIDVASISFDIDGASTFSTDYIGGKMRVKLCVNGYELRQEAIC